MCGHVFALKRRRNLFDSGKPGHLKQKTVDIISNFLYSLFMQKSNKKNKHKCKELIYCYCDLQALEPDENCPIHGFGPSIPRCSCGKFVMKIKYGKY